MLRFVPWDFTGSRGVEALTSSCLIFIVVLQVLPIYQRGTVFKTCKQHWTPREHQNPSYMLYIGDHTIQLNRELWSLFTNQYFVVHVRVLIILRFAQNPKNHPKKKKFCEFVTFLGAWWVKTWPEIIRVVLSDDSNPTRLGPTWRIIPGIVSR